MKRALRDTNILGLACVLAAAVAFAGCGGMHGECDNSTFDDASDDGSNPADDGSPSSESGDDAGQGADATVAQADAAPAGEAGESPLDAAEAAQPAVDGAPDATQGVVDAAVDTASPRDASDGGGHDGAQDAGNEAEAGAMGHASDAGDAGSDVTEAASGEAGLDATAGEDAHEAGTDGAADAIDAPLASVPDAPGLPAAVAGDTVVSLSWLAPADHGSSIVGYQVSVFPSGGVVMLPTPTSTTATVTGLTNGTLYSFAVVATNGVGSSPPSPAATAVPAGLPSAPTGVTAIAANASATVSWVPAAANGSALVGYAVVSSPGGGIVSMATPTSTTATVTGLANCATYTFTVSATNGIGTSVPSAPSSPVVVAPAPTVSYATDVQQAIFTVGYACTGCHGGAGGLTLDYASIVDAPAQELSSIPYVAPGDPGHSYLWCKVAPADADCVAAGTAITGLRMPYFGPPYLSDADQATLKTWIEECAPNN